MVQRYSPNEYFTESLQKSQNHQISTFADFCKIFNPKVKKSKEIFDPP